MAKGLSDDELKALIDAEMRQSVGYFGGKLANARQKALAYYEGLPKGDLAPPEIEGRSTVVSTEVRNVVLSMLPGLMEKFASGDDIVECEATKQQDEEAAKTATEYLNWMFLKKHAGHRILETAFLDALISKTGIIKVWWDTRVEETKEEYKGLTDVELAEILDDEEVEPVTHESYIDEEDIEQRQKAIEQLTQQIEQATQAAQQGNPQAQQAAQQMQMQIEQINAQPPVMLHNVSVKRSKKGGKICIENVPPEEFLISRKATSIENAPFIGHRVMRTQSELLSMGYKNAENLTSDDNQNMWSMERVERLTWDDDMSYLTQTESPAFDPAMRVIVVTEAYVKADRDGDGIAELLKVVKAGNEILEVEEVDVVPFVALRPVHMPHRFFGLSIADLAMEPQRIKTHVLRSILDNLHFQTNGRFFAVEGQVNLDDLLTSRPGGIVRVKTPQAVGRLDQGVSDSSGAMNMLQYMQGFTEEATGWSRTANAADDPNSINLTATAANLASNKANQRTDMVARNLAEGVRDLFKLMLKLICQHQDQVEDVKLGGKWVTIDPREWRNQFDIQISVGLGTGSKDQQVQQMLMLMQHQGMQLQAGLPTVNPENIYNANRKLTEALGYRNVDMFWQDPQKTPPQPPRPDPEMMKLQASQQQAQAQMQIEVQKHQAEMQAEMAKQQAQAEERQREIELENQRNLMQAKMAAEIDAAKAQHEMQLEQQRMEMEWRKAMLDAEVKLATAQISATKGADEATTQVADTSSAQLLQTIVEKITAPKMIIRDQSGRAMGIQ